MMALFVRFLRAYFEVEDTEWRSACSLPGQEEYWTQLLGLPVSCLRKHSEDRRPRTGRKQNRHEHGMCRLTLGRTDIKQHILGAITEYGAVA